MKFSANHNTCERLATGGVVYYDPQNGAFLDIEGVSGRVESFEILRVDKLLLREGIIGKISEAVY